LILGEIRSILPARITLIDICQWAIIFGNLSIQSILTS
jgi:hypothetical protein